MNGPLDVSLGQYSDKGRKPLNQDAHGASLPAGALRQHKGVALALADGISSSEVSQEASRLAVRAFLADYFSTPETWSVRQSVQRVLMATNTWLHAQTKRSLQGRHDQDRGHVCTFSAVVVKSATAHVFHVGDSRVGLVRGDRLEWLTEDHRLRVSSEKSYLTRALGVNAHLEIDHRRCELQAGDLLLLTTDGVHEYLPPERLCHAASQPDLEAAARALVEDALAWGSDDNLTVQLLRINALPPAGLPEIRGQAGELPFPPALQAGMNLEGYVLLRPLHASHRSHAWLAEEEARKALVVVKVPAMDVRDDPRHLERFLREEWIARRVDNPHVLKAPPEAHRRQSLYTVSEYVEGQTLAAWMTANPRPALDTVRTIVEQIVAGLRALHRKAIVHQDLRPENILIDASGKVTLIDFGSALVAGLSEQDSSASVEFTGTQQYSAPEHFLGEAGTWQSDLFSLGVITYQMLTGHLPYGTEVAGIRRRQALATLRYQSALAHNPDLPAWVDAVLSKTVHPQPEKRHAALSEFMFDLCHPLPANTRSTPSFLEKNPAFFWQIACFLLLMTTLWLLAR